MFWKKKKENKVKPFNYMAFLPDETAEKEIKIDEPMTIAKYRIEKGAKDFGYEKATKIYNNHKVKIKNQWINPLQSVNSGWGNAHGATYLYQPVNYYECYALAQDPMFNKIFNILSETPFSNGGEVICEFSDKEFDILEKSCNKYKVYEKMIQAVRSDFISGGCLVYMDFGLDDLSEPLDLSKMDMRKFKGFRHIDPINVTAIDVNTTNPAEQDYMKPKTWYVVGLGACDSSHFLKFEENEPELMMKPMCMYFGMPLTLLIKQDIANSNSASQGMANLMNRMRYTYLTTSNENFTGEGALYFRKRLEAMSMLQDNYQIFALGQDENIQQLTTSLAGMSENTEFFFQVLAAKTDITMSILMGKGSSGLSGTLEGERRNFYDRIRTIQSKVKENLIKMLGIVYGAATDGKFFVFADYVFNPLEQSSEKEKAENIRSYMEVAKGLIEIGCRQEDVLNWLKKFKDFHLDNIEFDTDTGDLIDYENGEFGNIENTKKIENSDFKESEHPRDESGKFTKKGIGDYSGKRDYEQGGRDGSIKTNKKFLEIMERVEKSNEKNFTPDEVIKKYLDENPEIKSDKIIEAIKKADSYRKEKEFVNEKGEKQVADTQFVFTYKDKEGKNIYTPEREKLHREILDNVLKNAKNAKPEKGQRPEFIILGGRGGSGKSKLKGLAYDEEHSIVLDADEIKKQLPEYKGFNAWEVHEESSDILKRALQIARQKGLNVVLDGTMSGFKSTEKKIEEFESAGYDVLGYYMHLPREESAKRGLGRYLTGGSAEGRYVPLDVMLGMKDNEANFQKLLPKFKKWAMWDNNVKRGEQPILVQKSWN